METIRSIWAIHKFGKRLPWCLHYATRYPSACSVTKKIWLANYWFAFEFLKKNKLIWNAHLVTSPVGEASFLEGRRSNFRCSSFPVWQVAGCRKFLILNLAREERVRKLRIGLHEIWRAQPWFINQDLATKKSIPAQFSTSVAMTKETMETFFLLRKRELTTGSQFRWAWRCLRMSAS